MSNFIPLTVQKIIRETDDCVQIRFEIPASHKQDFQFTPGQYLTLEHSIHGESVRRSYSICSTPSDTYLAVAVKQIPDGRFSTFANNTLAAGDILNSLTPDGNFTIQDPEDQEFMFIAAGSGITPIMSMISTLLATNPRADVTLMYGNKRTSSIIFQEALEDLKNEYMDRFNLIHVLSQELSESDLNNGRIDAQKCKVILEKSIAREQLEGVYLCGPSQMIMDIRDYLTTEGGITEEKVHYELFNTENLSDNSDYQKNLSSDKKLAEKVCKVTIDSDSRSYKLDLKYGGETILDAALKTGADLPFACKGGVCCTCRAKLLKGEVDMEKNYALEPEELEQGFILTCQAHPKSDEVHVSFDYA